MFTAPLDEWLRPPKKQRLSRTAAVFLDLLLLVLCGNRHRQIEINRVVHLATPLQNLLWHTVDLATSCPEGQLNSSYTARVSSSYTCPTHDGENASCV